MAQDLHKLQSRTDCNHEAHKGEFEMKVGRYDVSNSNRSGTQRSSVRVRLDGVILAEVFPLHSQPLKWIRTHANDISRKELIAQLRQNGVSDEDVALILKLPPKEST